MSVAKNISAFVAGSIFGIGLIVAGMSNPAKVLAFLDLFGAWDPSLSLVMIGAIGIGVFAFAFARRKRTAFLGDVIELPKPTPIDAQLIIGSALFGIGWGLAGVCPGPAFVVLGSGVMRVWFFVVPMLVGLWSVRYFLKQSQFSACN
ncbi:MAG: YeeE/YedE thiosulfate transporter family protein [Spongiibacteraceae bacterium]